MKRQITKWTLRLTAIGLLILVFLIGIVLNPNLLYANKTPIGNYTIYHNSLLNKNLQQRLDDATELLKSSGLYDANLKLDICLNDGSKYPALIRTLRGDAFAWGFYDKVVFMGNANYIDNYVELNGYKWNFTQLLAHEIIHCFQFNKFGLLKSNPIAKIPEWKWEGFPEYVARKNTDNNNLVSNIDRLLKTEKTVNNNWILFDDSTGTVISYYKNWLLLQYCLDIKKLTYHQLLNDTTSELTTNVQMKKWFANNQLMNQE